MVAEEIILSKVQNSVEQQFQQVFSDLELTVNFPETSYNLISNSEFCIKSNCNYHPTDVI